VAEVVPGYEPPFGKGFGDVSKPSDQCVIMKWQGWDRTKLGNQQFKPNDGNPPQPFPQHSQHPGHWIWDDVEAVRREPNATSRPPGSAGPTLEELWADARRSPPRAADASAPPGQRLKPFDKCAYMIESLWDGIALYCHPENKVALGFVGA